MSVHGRDAGCSTAWDGMMTGCIRQPERPIRLTLKREGRGGAERAMTSIVGIHPFCGSWADVLNPTLGLGGPVENIARGSGRREARTFGNGHPNACTIYLYLIAIAVQSIHQHRHRHRHRHHHPFVPRGRVSRRFIASDQRPIRHTRRPHAHTHNHNHTHTHSLTAKTNVRSLCPHLPSFIPFIHFSLSLSHRFFSTLYPFLLTVCPTGPRRQRRSTDTLSIRFPPLGLIPRPSTCPNYDVRPPV